MANRETIKQQETIYQGPIFSIETDEVTLADGQSAQRDIVRHVPAIGLLALTDDHQMYLEKQWRSTVDGFVIEIPAGKLDERDQGDHLHAAQRELNEELRLTSGQMNLVSEFYETVGFSDAYMYLYEAKELAPAQQELPRDLGESFDIFTVTQEQMGQMIADKEIKDAKTILAYYIWLSRG